jgi:NADP-dependent 3-hydroxy acid dehydrogenase YdfG
MKNINGKTALITGASSGLGEAYALKLASMGVKVILVARRADRLRTLADRI